MCGIFGYSICGDVASIDSKKFFNFLYHLGVESESRGQDSTGFSAIVDSNLVTDKLPLRAASFGILSPKFLSFREKTPKVFIGHTRYGTGSSPLINNNNHPFYGSNFHMVHNGVVPSWQTYVTRYDLSMESETDSEVILRVIEENLKASDLNTSISKMLEAIWGNMAVALLSKSGELFLFRNENPIHLFQVPEDIFGAKVIFFCSTDSIFHDAWVEALGTFPKADNVSSKEMDSHTLVSIHNGLLLEEPLKVENKFRKSMQYGFGYYGYDDLDEFYTLPPKKGKKVYFVSHPLNTSVYVNTREYPIAGLRLTSEEVSRIVNNKEGADFTVDGLPVKDYFKMKESYTHLLYMGM